jgi:tight adherence protein B
MAIDPQTLLNTVLIGSVFLLVLSLWIGAVLLWTSRRAKRSRAIEERLELHDDAEQQTRVVELWQDGRRLSVRVPIVSHRSFVHRLDQYCERAGLSCGIGPVVAVVGALAATVTGFVILMSGNWIMGIAVGMAIVVIARIYLSARVSRRDALFATQFVDAMELAARSLRAGHPLLSAFQLIAAEMPDPISSVFGDMCKRHELGAGMEETLQQTARDSHVADLKLFATSVAIQIRTGGNLADLIDRLAAVIRLRMRLNRRFKVLTAQTQFSKRVLLGLPFVLFVLLSIINPNYMRPLFSTTPGQIMVACALAGLALGAWMMSRMVQIKF